MSISIKSIIKCLPLIIKKWIKFLHFVHDLRHFSKLNYTFGEFGQFLMPIQVVSHGFFTNRTPEFPIQMYQFLTNFKNQIPYNFNLMQENGNIKINLLKLGQHKLIILICLFIHFLLQRCQTSQSITIFFIQS